MPKIKMGELIARYDCRPIGMPDVFTLLLPGILAVGLPLGIGYQRVQLAQVKYGPAAAAVWGQPWYGLAILGLCVFIILAIYRLWLSHRSVTIYQRGLHLNLRKPLSLRWENMAGVRVDATRQRFLFLNLGTRYRAWLLPATGKPVYLPHDLQQLPELLTQIKAHLYPRLSKEMKNQFVAGKRLYFGPISIQIDGFSLQPSPAGKNHASTPIQPWSKLQQMNIEHGFLVLKFEGSKASRFAVADIPNIELLHEIIQQDVPNPFQ